MEKLARGGWGKILGMGKIELRRGNITSGIGRSTFGGGGEGHGGGGKEWEGLKEGEKGKLHSAS